MAYVNSYVPLKVKKLTPRYRRMRVPKLTRGYKPAKGSRATEAR